MEERIKGLFRKYLTNNCTREEFEEVFHYLQSEGNDPVMREQLRQLYEEELGVLPSEVFVGADGALAGMEEAREDLQGVREGMQSAREAVQGACEAVQEEGTSDGGVEAVAGLRRKKSRLAGMAAVLLVLVVGGMIWREVLRAPARPEDRTAALGGVVRQATQRSEYKHLMLPDSTEVWLDADSRLEFPASFGSGERRVTLTGEAFFDVKHAERTPFIIYTGKVSTEVLGTSFNIKAYPNMEKITVAVKRGKVKVKYADRPVALLTMGQQVSIFNKDSTVRVKSVAAQKTYSWEEGSLVYDDYTIGDIIADLERVYNVQIVLGNPAVGNIRVSTAFRRKDSVVKALEVLGGLTDTEPAWENGRYVMK